MGNGLGLAHSWAQSLPEDVNWELANDGRGQTTVGSALALPGLVQVWPPWPLWGKRRFLSVQLQLCLQVSNLG